MSPWPKPSSTIGNLGLWTLDCGLHIPVRLLVFLRFAGVEHHAVARFQRTFEADENAIAQHARDFAEKHAAFLSETGMNELLIVGAAEPAGVQAAGEGHFHFVSVIRRGELLRAPLFLNWGLVELAPPKVYQVPVGRCA